MLNKRTTRPVLTIMLTLAALGLPACSTATPSPLPSIDRTEGRPAEADIPEFTGSWAEDFREQYRLTTTDKARAMLSDGVVTAAEYAEVRESLLRCAAERGVTIEAIRIDGSREFSFETITSDEANDVMNRCEDESGDSTVGTLWYWMQRNPAQLDEDELVLSCLHRIGVVDQGVTIDQYRAGRQDPARPLPSKREMACIRDPNGTK
ncbi:hypothetical protein D9V32_09835 [Mycetocola tolaasinivorans]|uniref:Lipoprotein n=1 Tax=Mycetocola tolaasinivorans TaxID=76635 RepID=A0A3L7A787_9MICO|nr:hypothetical protein [Mycetocola tolaasinivorans]RLP75748.1 hypothetical protein D9V32_09835 [Mycetocola tolaasinivorans]